MRDALSRREFGALAGSALLSLCGVPVQDAQSSTGRLWAVPRGGPRASISGERALGLDGARDAILQMPAATREGPYPLVLALHGAGGSGRGILRRLGGAASAAGVVALAPDSRGSTWDAIRGRLGADVAFIDKALEKTFGLVSIDPKRVAIAGFSDGASYALSLGLINGALFTRIAAFSPGFVVEEPARGQPRVFISHGTADPVLPIDRCSRRIVPMLRERRYTVTYREFEGGHTVPDDIAAEAMKWIAG